jgi:hypothetical protein
MADQWLCLDLSSNPKVPEVLQRLYGTKAEILSFLERNTKRGLNFVGEESLHEVNILRTNQWDVMPYAEEFADGQSLRANQLAIKVWYIDDPHHGRLRVLITYMNRLAYSVDGGETYSPIPISGAPYFGLLKLLKRDDDQVIKNTLAFVDGLVDDQEVSISQALYDPKQPFMWPWWEALDLKNEEDEKV